MLGKQMPGLGVEKLLDHSMTGAFLMRTYGAEKRLTVGDTAEHAQKNTRSFCMTNGRLLESEPLVEKAHLAAMLDGWNDVNPTVLLVNFGEKSGMTELWLRAYSKEGMQKQHSAEKVIDRLEKFLTGSDGVLDAILREFEL